MSSPQDSQADVTQALPAGPQAPEKLFDRRYRVLRLIGEGGCGRVLLVEDALHPGEKLALKVILPKQATTPEFERRFRNEIRVLRALTHPAIPQIYNDGKTEEGEFYYTMAFVEGRTLEEVLKESGPLDPVRIVRLVKQVLTVLDYAHAHGVVHRDLKPQNIMLVGAGDEGEEVKVLDFGIAKVLSAEGPLEHMLTQETSVAIGTPHYMSPEQVRGKEVDARTDLYALGIIIYRMVSGELPFGGKTMMEILTARLEHDPEPLAGKPVPAWLGQLVMSLLAREKEKRPTTQEIQLQLDQLGRGQTRLQRRLSWSLASGAVVIALVASTILRAPQVEGSSVPEDPSSGGTTTSGGGKTQGGSSSGGGTVPISPSVEIEQPLDGSHHRGAVRFTGLAIALERVLVEGETVEVDASGRFDRALTLERGRQTVTIADPAAGEGAAPLASRTLVVDDEPPTLVFMAEGVRMDDGSYLVGDERLVVRGSAADAAPGKLAGLRVGGREVFLDRDGSFETIVPLAEGANEIELVAFDAAGNEISSRLRSVLDATAPALTVIAPAGADLTTKEAHARIEVEAEGEHLGQLSIRWSKSDGKVSDWNGALADGRFVDEAVPLEVGENEFQLSARDLAGNASRPVRIRIRRELPPHEPTEVPPPALPAGFAALAEFGVVASGRPARIRHGASGIDLVYVAASAQHADAFYVARTEVTRAQYERLAGAHPASDEHAADPDRPVVDVSWDDAREACRAAGLVLPTREEWLHAARGPERNAFPWGSSWVPGLANVLEPGAQGKREPAAVGSFPEDASWCGAVDMAGNVSEWCTDGAGTGKRLCGASFNTQSTHAHSDAQKNPDALRTAATIGFRPVLRIAH